MGRCDIPRRECLHDHVKPNLRDAKPNGQHKDSYIATCPICGSNLSVSVGEKQRIVWKCHSKCNQVAVRAALVRDAVPADCLGLPRNDEGHLVDEITALYQKDIGHAERLWRIYSLINGFGGEAPPRRAYPGGVRGFAGDAGVSRTNIYRAGGSR